jgi:malate dehydrogenase
VIAARGHSSAASAANAAVDHVRSMVSQTPAGNWISAGVSSDGSYGIDEGLFSSVPIASDGQGGYSIVQGLSLSDWARQKLEASLAELRTEKEIVADLLK